MIMASASGSRKSYLAYHRMRLRSSRGSGGVALTPIAMVCPSLPVQIRVLYK